MSLLAQNCRHWTPRTPSGSRCEACRQETAAVERQRAGAEQARLNALPLLERMQKTSSTSSEPRFFSIVAELEKLAYPKSYEKYMEFWNSHPRTSGAGFPPDPSYGGWSLQDAQATLNWVRAEAVRLAGDLLRAEKSGTTPPDMTPYNELFLRMVANSRGEAVALRDEEVKLKMQELAAGRVRDQLAHRRARPTSAEVKKAREEATILAEARQRLAELRAQSNA